MNVKGLGWGRAPDRARVRRTGGTIIPMRKRPILAVAAVAIPVVIVSVLLGFKTQQPFLSNLLAGVACIGLGAMVGVFLVDRFVQYDRRAQWARSRNYVLSGIASHLSDAATDLFIFMPISDHRPMGLIIEGRSRPNPLTIEGFREVARQLKSVKRSPSP